MRKRNGPGLRPYPAARELKIPYPWLKKAIATGDVRTITFGNVEIVPNAELNRLDRMFSGDEENSPAA
ncbi:hypothetical protein I6F15_00110 [Bradyrhizobium sp. BRP14]|nr:hypothetical protein [Bradyrhizobium sp. BRP14]